MADVIARLRDHLITRGLVRNPQTQGPGARPWLPPAWKHPDDGPVAPGEAADMGKSLASDDGLVVSLLWAPGIPPAAGAEQRRIDGVDIVLRGVAMPQLLTLEQAIRLELLGAFPGGRTDWTMDGLYIIQSKQWRPMTPLAAEDGIFTFSTGYTFETQVP